MTAQDLKPYEEIIKQMRGSLASPEFELLFAEKTADLSKPKQFLLKMELRRLAQPCNYFIDLRGHVEGLVKAFEYKGKTHYLDEHAKQLFTEGIAAYGQYTVGVYEEVMNADNNFRVRHRKETDARIQSTLETLRAPTKPSNQPSNSLATMTADTTATVAADKFIQFGQYILRQEERMNLALEIEVSTAFETFQAITSDISLSGSKIKVNAERQIKVGDTLNVQLKGLEKEFTLDLPHGLDFQVVRIEQQDKFAYWQLKRLNSTATPGFNQFLENYINNNKRRYKVNLDNTQEALITKGYEQFYLPRINTLPVFIQLQAGKPESRFCLTSDFNKSIWLYFLDEQQQSALPQLLSARRLKILLQQAATQQAELLYCFTHAVKGKLYFYAALAAELIAEPELARMFFGFGAGKPSWRIFRLSINKTSVKNSHNEFALPGSHGQQAPSPLVTNMLADMAYLVNIADISIKEQRTDYANQQFDPGKLANLNKFGLIKTQQPAPIEAVAIHYRNLRAEPRYLYRTTVIVHESATRSMSAFTRDFSTGGMQIELNEPINLNKGDLLTLDLPDLQKITTQYQLEALAYQIMAVSKNQRILNLKVAKTEHHPAKQFFRQLIHSNKNKLTEAAETPKYPGLASALKNMYLKAFNHFVLFVHRHNLRLDLKVMATGALPSSLQQLLQLSARQSPPLSFAPLHKEYKLNHELANQIKQMRTQDPARTYELVVRVTKIGNKIALSSHFSFEFEQAETYRSFVLDALTGSALFVYRLYFSRTDALDIDYVAKELNYVSVYAIHKAKSFEEELMQVEGVLEGIDISDELCMRLNPAELTNQRLKRQAVLARLTA